MNETTRKHSDSVEQREKHTDYVTSHLESFLYMNMHLYTVNLKWYFFKQIFMLRVATHPVLSQDKIFIGFMQRVREAGIHT